MFPSEPVVKLLRRILLTRVQELHSQATILDGGISQKRVVVCVCELVMVVFVLCSLILKQLYH